MNEYSKFIERGAVIKAASENRAVKNGVANIETITDIVASVPNANAVFAKKGHWSTQVLKDGSVGTACWRCYSPAINELETPYCPYCGARMTDQGGNYIEAVEEQYT